MQVLAGNNAALFHWFVANMDTLVSTKIKINGT